MTANHEADDVESTVNEVEALKEFLPSYDGFTEGSPKDMGRWPQGDAEGGWLWETPVGSVPMGPMNPDEFLLFVESCEKPWPKEDPRRVEGQ